MSESISVTVLNPVADFVERIRLHEVAAGSRESASVPMLSLLHERALMVRGTAPLIGPEHRKVRGRAPLEQQAFKPGPGRNVSVIGAGLTGIEAASEISEYYPHLQVGLISRGVIADGLSLGGRLRY